MDYFFFIKSIVDKTSETARANGKPIDTDSVARDFKRKLEKSFTDAQFSVLLMTTGFIPDLYANDSSEETLYSKLVEVLVCEWADRMGFSGECVKQKASFEDVTIRLDKSVIVCDAKSFRLGRSQAAPNVKDFLKLEDIRKWLSRYPNKLGGLVTYPDMHEWKYSSDAYQYCSTKDMPTVMLPYKYLALLLNFKDEYDTAKLKVLWNYEKIFPQPLKKTMPDGNKKAYWSAINNKIISTTGISKEKFDDFLYCADMKIEDCVQANLRLLMDKRDELIKLIRQEVNALNTAQLRNAFAESRIKSETTIINSLIGHIQEFRM